MTRGGGAAGRVLAGAVLARPGGRAGAALATLVLAAALMLPAVTPDPYVQPDLLHGALQPPTLAHPFGTDQLSRDVLARVALGARLSLGIALGAVVISTALGAAVGLAAALGGAWCDALLMRLVDGALAVPRLFVLLLALAAQGELGAGPLALVLGATGWLVPARLVRAAARQLAHAPFVAAAEALGATRRRIAWRHLLPGVTGTLLAWGSLAVTDVVLLEAGLSFLGLGLTPPAPSWGTMLYEGREVMHGAPWTVLPAALALVLTALAFWLLGDALRAGVEGEAA